MFGIKILFEVVMVFATIVSAYTPPAPQRAVSFQVTFSGSRPCSDVINYVASVPQQINATVSWDRVLTFKNEEMGQVIANLYVDPATRKYVRVALHDFELRQDMDCAHMMQVARKELEGNPVAFQWVIDHPNSYTSQGEFGLLVDGLAVQYLAAELEPVLNANRKTPIVLLRWDGISEPTCAQLAQIVELRRIGVLEKATTPDHLTIQNACK